MMRKWEIVTSGPEVAHAVMERDAQLLASLEACPRPILHLYEWAGPSATYGHFIRLEEHVDLEAAGVEGVTFAKRPTGGGIVFHITDLAFSLLLPANDPECSSIPIENYQFVNRIVAQAVEKLVGERLTLLPTEEEPAGPAGFCMARPTRYDVMWGDKKIGGAAQRRTRHGYLHQGTIAIAPMPTELLSRLLRNAEVVRQMSIWSPALLKAGWTPDDLSRTRQSLRQGLIDSLPL